MTEDVVQGSLLHGIPATFVYFPTVIDAAPALSLLARGRSDTAATSDAIQSVIDMAHPDVAYETRSVRDLVALQGRSARFPQPPRFQGWWVCCWHSPAPTVSWRSSQRRREFGVRMALGATETRIVRGMVGSAMRMSTIGAGAGALLAFAMARAASAVLEFIPAFGSHPYVIGVAIVMSASVLAAWLPSARAARMDPSAALRRGVTA